MKTYTYLSLFILSFTFLNASVYKEITISELQKEISNGTVGLIDVNGAKSFAKAHIPGAIDFSSKGKNLENLLPSNKDTLVVAYCGGPSCRAYLRGAKAASELGYKNVRHLSAGISGWKKAGLKVESK
jgi:rhodanese-related sulfurtransferase